MMHDYSIFWTGVQSKLLVCVILVLWKGEKKKGEKCGIHKQFSSSVTAYGFSFRMEKFTKLFDGHRLNKFYFSYINSKIEYLRWKRQKKFWTTLWAATSVIIIMFCSRVLLTTTSALTNPIGTRFILSICGPVNWELVNYFPIFLICTWPCRSLRLDINYTLLDWHVFASSKMTLIHCH